MYLWVKQLHIITAVISITLFVLRFYWKWRSAAVMKKRWIKIAPHVNDTVLLVTGVALIFITHFYPFSIQGAWLTEKLIGVIIYIGLGHIALGKRLSSQMVRAAAFVAAVLCFFFIASLAINKIPVVMEYA